jgi:hypothetical protein
MTEQVTYDDTPCGIVLRIDRRVRLSQEAAFLGFYDARLRATWLEAPITIRKAIAASLLKCAWTDGQLTLDVRFTRVDGRETDVHVEHRRLRTKRDANTMTRYWRRALTLLESTLSSRPSES